jgi:hypothetical protein
VLRDRDAPFHGRDALEIADRYQQIWGSRIVFAGGREATRPLKMIA